LRSDLPQGILTIVGFATAVVFFLKEKDMELKELNMADITLIVMMATGFVIMIIGLVADWRERHIND